MLRILTLVIALSVILAPPCAACLNDGGTERSERRFRDSYADPGRAQRQCPGRARRRAGFGLVLPVGTDVALVGGALALVVGAQRRAVGPGRARRRLAQRVDPGSAPATADTGSAAPFRAPRR